MAEYKVLKDFGEVKTDDIITTEGWADEERAERIADGSIAEITADEPKADDTANVEAKAEDDAKTDAKDITPEVDAEKEASDEQKDITS